VRARVSTYLEKLDIKRESVEALRPWRAYYVINSAFWSHRKLPYEEVYVDEILKEAAKSQGKNVGYEMPTRLDFARFMAGMPNSAQSEYVSWLLDYKRSRKAGLVGSMLRPAWSVNPGATPRFDSLTSRLTGAVSPKPGCPPRTRCRAHCGSEAPGST
jgi:uncharacterized protein YbaP (TraB family)